VSDSKHTVPPILFLIFNRPDLALQAFSRIRAARPEHLFIAADGPRAGFPDDIKNCAETRNLIGKIDWDCRVQTLFRKENLGCKRAVSSSITWFFENVEQGIILEEDCLADLSFFRFCAELLEYYRNDERIMVISGNNFQDSHIQPPYSYYFSRYNHCWGWATWNRSWRHFDGDLKLWPMLKDGYWIQDIIGQEAYAYWQNVFNRSYAGEIDSWAYPWTFSCWVQSGLSILPKVNLVSNIGFDERATHTKDPKSNASNLPACAMDFPLNHPPFVIRNSCADRLTFQRNFKPSPPSRPRLIRRFIQHSPIPYGDFLKPWLRSLKSIFTSPR